MKLIVLTQTNPFNESVFLNVDHIVAFRKENNFTQVYLINTTIAVLETPEQVRDMIND